MSEEISHDGDKFSEVSSDVFYSAINEKDVCIKTLGNYPYTLLFVGRGYGLTYGKVVDVIDGGLIRSKYYLTVIKRGGNNG